MKTSRTRQTAMLVAFLVGISAGAVGGENWRRLMTEGKLDADLGKHDEASASFRAIAEDEGAPPSLRGEALVRLGLARSAAGDPEAGAEAFRTVLGDYAGDPEAMHFLTRVVASGVPGKIWVDLKERFEELLRTARVVSVEELGPGMMSRKVELRQDGVELSAVWRHFSAAKGGDSYIYEAAAYEIDKMLGLDMVPPTVVRTLEDEDGTLQLWVYGCRAVNPSASEHPPRPAEWRRQSYRMNAFDYLIANRDRNRGNILVDPKWEIVLVDHTRAFSSDPAVISQDRGEPPELPDRFDRQLVERLRGLGPSEFQTRMKGLLTEVEANVFLARREELLAHVEKLLAEKGEEAVLF